jgi:DNA-binding CsgD family transcriptional regulator
MTTLSASDLRAALDFVGEAYSFEDLDSFRAGILPGLARLVPADLAGYNEVDPGNGEALVVLDPELSIETGEALSRLAHQHPLISLHLKGDRRTHKISDFLTRRQFHALELYDELYRHLEAEDQIAFGLPGPVVIGIALNRGRRDFTERDRALLDLLRPHLAQAHRRLVREAERTLTPEALQPLGQGLTPRQAEILCLLVDGQGIADIAATLFISTGTVRKHCEHIYERLGVHTRAAAVAMAVNRY